MISLTTGFSLAERAGGVGDGDGPASEGDHLLGQVPASNLSFLSLCSALITRAVNIHPDDTFILTMRAQASEFQVCVIPGISDLLQAKLAVADYQGAMEDASNVMFRA